jgi:hypothetical protein
MTTEGIEMRSVGNTLTLHETALIEAFNLRAAIEYHLKNCKYQTKFQVFYSLMSWVIIYYSHYNIGVVLAG